MKLVISKDVELFNTVKRLFDEFQKDSVLVKNDISKDILDNVFYKHIPKEPIFRSRPIWDCRNCRYAIREMAKTGRATQDFKLETFFEYLLSKVELSGEVEFFSRMFKEYNMLWSIDNIIPYTIHDSKISTRRNLAIIDGEEFIFDHFYIEISSEYVKRDITSVLNRIRSTEAFYNKFKDHLDVIEDILDYIDDGIIYRGEEKRKVVKDAIKAIKILNSGVNPRLYAIYTGGIMFNSDVIATLAEDLVNGIDEETAINRYNEKVAPYNYQQIKKKILTKTQVKALQRDLKELGFEDITTRFKYANFQDLNINTVLWTNRLVKKGSIDRLLSDFIVEKKAGETISLEEFLNILPNTSEIEVANLPSKVVLIKDTGDKSVYYWGNNIGFCYEGGLADHDFVTEKVKAAGGNIDAELRFSLYWENLDDLDLHLKGAGVHLYFGHKKDTRTNFVLDVDMNARGPIRGAVENIYAEKITSKDVGKEFIIYVHNYLKRERAQKVILNVYYRNELIKQYELKNPPEDVKIDVCKVLIDENKTYKIKDLIPSKIGINNDTIQFKQVHTVLFSPNWWGSECGNKHIFFLCNDITVDTSSIRPYLPEQLRSELKPHRRALSILAEKIKISGEPELIGIGVSFGKERNIPIKIDGRKFLLKIEPARDYKITPQTIEAIHKQEAVI